MISGVGLAGARPSIQSRHRLLLPLRLACLAFLSLSLTTLAEDLPPGFHAWLARQSNTTSWHAELTQTRHLKSLTQPLISPGRVWFKAPNQFRWEIGTPPKTIAARQTNQLLLLYPDLKRAETYPLDSGHGPWRDSMTLLEAGFPRSADDLQSRFRILSVVTNGPVLEIALQPRAAQARRWMPRLLVSLLTNDLSLAATELTFADGSRLHNAFTNAVLNPDLGPDLFNPAIPPDYLVSRPAARP